VFVLTHYARDPIPMEGGTTFHFVTEGIDVALQRAFDAARGLDVRLGGGVATIQDYVRPASLTSSTWQSRRSFSAPVNAY
jgi:dihydrofolate reductase